MIEPETPEGLEAAAKRYMQEVKDCEEALLREEVTKAMAKDICDAEPSLEEMITTGHVPIAPELEKGADYAEIYTKVQARCRAIAARHPYMELVVNHSFEAAHRLPKHTGKCRRVHGHSYRVRVVVRGGGILSDGMVIDFQVVKGIIDQLDHQYLNDIIKNPTAELTAQWLLEHIPGAVEVRLWEGLGGCSVVARV